MDKLLLNADKNADKWTFEKVANQQTLGNAGGSAGSRTPDHLIKSQMLYQLSYRPTASRKYCSFGRKVQAKTRAVQSAMCWTQSSRAPDSQVIRTVSSVA